MRVILVGTPSARARLQRALAGSGVEIAGEAESIASVPSTFDADGLLLAPHASGAESAPGETLTPREREVLDLVAEGLPNKAVALRLHISDQTVKFHVASICGKLGAMNRTEAVRIGIRRGLVTV